MNENQKQRLREIWIAVKESHGDTWPQTCEEMKDDFMAGIGEGESVMGRAILVAFQARRQGNDDVADLILALGYEFSANDPTEGKS